MWEKNTIQAPVDILERSPGWGGKKFIGKKSTVVFCPPNMANCSRQCSRLADMMYYYFAEGFPMDCLRDAYGGQVLGCSWKHVRMARHRFG